MMLEGIMFKSFAVAGISGVGRAVSVRYLDVFFTLAAVLIAGWKLRGLMGV
jgi:hypothetical protein